MTTNTKGPEPVAEQLACCAHRRVDMVPIQHADGTLSDRWLCRDCLIEFVPRDLCRVPEEMMERLRASVSSDPITGCWLNHGDRMTAELLRDLLEALSP